MKILWIAVIINIIRELLAEKKNANKASVPVKREKVNHPAEVELR